MTPHIVKRHQKLFWQSWFFGFLVLNDQKPRLPNAEWKDKAMFFYHPAIAPLEFLHY